MAGTCYGVKMGETETSNPVEPSSKSARRRRMEIHQFNFVPNDSTVAPPPLPKKKRQRIPPPTASEIQEIVKDTCNVIADEQANNSGTTTFDLTANPSDELVPFELPKFGITSVCGRRRDMEDTIAIHPSLCNDNSTGLHFFGVYDGHGCSHVATKCKERMHEIVKEEYGNGELPWENIMKQSFSKMDREVTHRPIGVTGNPICRCELQTPHCDNVGSTAVVSVLTPDKIIISNCGDSRAVLCRNGVAIPLSVDHKPDRPDELERIEDAGGRVIFWDCPRVFGVLAMSRAIGDNYLKPYVIPEPEVTITDRTLEDDCLILASDGLWDVVSNETACGVARMCLQSRKPPSPPRSPGADVNVTEAGESSDKACSDASILLTKLALARHTTDNVSVVVVDLRRG